MTTIIRSCLIATCMLLAGSGQAQITFAKITYERKTNLFKKYKDYPGTLNWLKEEDKIKIDYFELFVTDTFSLFRPQESELRETNSWATSKNTVYQDFRHNNRFLVKSFWGEKVYLTDTILHRNWKITESSRKIAGYACRKAVWYPNDSTRIYAWFSYDLTPSSGPERLGGLPGTILGLATEDGGVVYFAKSVEPVAPDGQLFQTPKKKKINTAAELKEQLTKRYGHEKWFMDMIREQFGVW